MDSRRVGKVRLSEVWLLEALGLDPAKHQIKGTTDYDLEYSARSITVVVEGHKMPEIVPGGVLTVVQPSIKDGEIVWPDPEDQERVG